MSSSSDVHVDPRITRRGFLQAAGLTFGFVVGLPPRDGAASSSTAGETLAPNIWVNIAPDGIITIVNPSVEMGQGTMTALPIILAEELDADWSDVRIKTSPSDDGLYGNPGYAGILRTGASATLAGYYDTLRLHGAQARRVLLDSAAAKWNVPVEELATEPSVVVHRNSGRRLTYGEVAGFTTMPANPPDIEPDDLKDPAEFRLIGHDIPRADIPDKVDGSAQYSMDVRLPGMVYATVLRPPVRGALPEQVSEGEARKIPGVLDVVRLPYGVGVVSETVEGALAARAGQRAGDRGAARASSEPGDHMEAAAARRAAGGVCRGRGPQGRPGARGEDPGPARQDRGAHGRAGFFSARAQALSRAERGRMIERDGPLSLSRQCALLGVSRSSQYYRPKGESAEDLALMRRMDGLHTAYPFYGSRQLMRHLRREGVAAGRHRIRRLMRLMGMEATYRRPRTSVASPEHRVFPYLLRGLTISRADHVWCAYITYVPVTQGFFYLVAVMDWATRHVLAWRLSNTMDASFCVQALDDALGWRAPEILNTDQGSQFTSEAFADRVLGAGVRFSMDGRGRFLDNIFIERLWRSLKYEAVYLYELRDGPDAQRIIGSWIDFYNEARPHSSLGGRTPGEAYREGAEVW